LIFLSELNCCPAHGQHAASHEFHPFVQIGQLLKFVEFDKIKVVEIYSTFNQIMLHLDENYHVTYWNGLLYQIECFLFLQPTERSNTVEMVSQQHHVLRDYINFTYFGF
jgi:hypothetical protein